GHNSVVMDEHGNPVLVYHARPNPAPNAGEPGAGGLWDPNRHTAVKSVNVRGDGWLALDVTSDEEVATQFKLVHATIVVGDSVATPEPTPEPTEPGPVPTDPAPKPTEPIDTDGSANPG